MSHNLLRCSTYTRRDTLVPLLGNINRATIKKITSTHFPLARSGLLTCLLELYGGRDQAASCWSVIWRQQILLNTPSIHLSLFLCDTEWTWQAPGRPSLDLVTQFNAVCITAVPLCSLVHLWAPQLTHPHHPASCEHMSSSNTCSPMPTSFPPGDPASNIQLMLAILPKKETWFVSGYHIAGSTLELSREKRFSTRRDNDGVWLLVNYGHSTGQRFRNERAGDNPIICDVWIMDFVYEAFFNTSHWMFENIIFTKPVMISVSRARGKLISELPTLNKHYHFLL